MLLCPLSFVVGVAGSSSYGTFYNERYHFRYWANYGHLTVIEVAQRVVGLVTSTGAQSNIGMRGG